MKRSFLIPVSVVCMIIMLAGCVPDNKLVDCNSNSGTYICYNSEGREANYARWNFDTVDTYNVFNVQGSYLPIPGTTGPWITINISFINSMGNMAVETGSYDYYDFLTNSGDRRFTFIVKRYLGD